MKKLLILISIVTPLLSAAQLFEGEDYEYNSELIWGISKSSNGGLIGGLMVRYSRSKGENFYETFGLEMANVKHPSETRYVGIQGQSYIYGKANYLYAIRMLYGREKLFFKKASQQGVQISAAVSAGPTLGLENPYYVLETGGEYARFDPIEHPSPESVAGPGKLLQGIGESKVVPGLTLKASSLFEFGTYRSNVAGVEIGVLVDAYTREVQIVPTQSNRSVYPSVFFTLFWGTRK